MSSRFVISILFLFLFLRYMAINICLVYDVRSILL